MTWQTQKRKLTKYRFLVDTIKEKIKNGEYEPGERMESENTLSDQFGYSRQTVRQALSVLEQEGLIERRRGSGTYISSESRRTPRGNSIAIVTTYISDYIFPTIIRGIEETLTNAGYDLTLNVTNNHVEEEARILQSLISRRVDGVIVEGTKTAFPNPNVELYRRLEKMGVPVVFFNSYYRDLPDSVYVVTDDRKAGLQAVDLLIEKGCRRIGGVFKSRRHAGPRALRGLFRGAYPQRMRPWSTTMWFGTRRPSAAGFFAPTTATTCLSACAGVTALCATTTRLRMG